MCALLATMRPKSTPECADPVLMVERGLRLLHQDLEAPSNTRRRSPYIRHMGIIKRVINRANGDKNLHLERRSRQDSRGRRTRARCVRFVPLDPISGDRPDKVVTNVSL